MASKKQREQMDTNTGSKQADGDTGTRSGQPSPENVPSRSTEHRSGYGGEGGAPRTSTDQRETPKKSQ